MTINQNFSKKCTFDLGAYQERVATIWGLTGLSLGQIQTDLLTCANRSKHTAQKEAQGRDYYSSDRTIARLRNYAQLIE